MLSRTQWCILDSLVNGSEPFEVVDGAVEEAEPESTPQDTLGRLFELYQLGFVTLLQEPITPLGQSFPNKVIAPQCPEEVVADLGEEFAAYSTTRDYLHRLDLEGKGEAAGVPFGIWAEMTRAGKEEWNRRQYDGFPSIWQRPDSDEE